MVEQIIANVEREDASVADKTPVMQRVLVKRMTDAISTHIGLCEIRMNLFLWGLFRNDGKKESRTAENSRRPSELKDLVC